MALKVKIFCLMVSSFVICKGVEVIGEFRLVWLVFFSGSERVFGVLGRWM